MHQQHNQNTSRLKFLKRKGKMKPISYETTISPTKLSMHDYSRKISKLKPKIRIIHIVAPEIINTDAKNFRELVQKLTGKPVELNVSSNKADIASPQILPPKPYNRKPEKKTVQETHTMKKEIDELYEGDNPNAFLSFFGDVDGFLQDTNEFPLISLRSSQINMYGHEMPLC